MPTLLPFAPLENYETRARFGSYHSMSPVCLQTGDRRSAGFIGRRCYGGSYTNYPLCLFISSRFVLLFVDETRRKIKRILKKQTELAADHKRSRLDTSTATPIRVTAAFDRSNEK